MKKSNTAFYFHVEGRKGKQQATNSRKGTTFCPEAKQDKIFWAKYRALRMKNGAKVFIPE